MAALLIVIALVGFSLPLLRLVARAVTAPARPGDSLTSLAELPLPSASGAALRRPQPRWPVPRPADTTA